MSRLRHPHSTFDPGARPAPSAEVLSLPDNLDAERFVLGALLTVPGDLHKVALVVEPSDFSLDKHRCIYKLILDKTAAAEHIDRVTIADGLAKLGYLESIGGLSYIISLDDGMPALANIESYARIIKEKSLYRRLITLAQTAIGDSVNQGEPPLEIAGRVANRLIELAKGEQKREGLLSLEGLAGSEPDTLARLEDPSQAATGLRTGFVRLDQKTGGLEPGDLLILAARPSMGKTALALNIAWNVATNPRRPSAVAIFSLEMSRAQLFQRLICAAASVDHLKHRTGYLNTEERERVRTAIVQVAEAPILVDDTSQLSTMAIYAELLRLKATSPVPLGLAVIDYLQLMRSDAAGGGRGENRTTELSAMTRSLKLMAKELAIPILVLSQLSRAPETRPGDHRPILSDLRESGSIEQDADLVAFIFREEVYRPDKESLRGIAELLIAKQRNGPTGKIKLAFLKHYLQFANLADDVGDEEPLQMTDQPPQQPPPLGPRLLRSHEQPPDDQERMPYADW